MLHSLILTQFFTGIYCIFCIYCIFFAQLDHWMLKSLEPICPCQLERYMSCCVKVQALGLPLALHGGKENKGLRKQKKRYVSCTLHYNNISIIRNTNCSISLYNKGFFIIQFEGKLKTSVLNGIPLFPNRWLVWTLKF